MSCRRGLALPEAIIAIFILVAGFVVTAALFHTALRYVGIIERQALAVVLAEQKIEEIRAWSRRVHGTGGSESFSSNASWSAYDGVTEPAPDRPEIEISVSAEPDNLFSPSSQFERARFSAQENEGDKVNPAAVGEKVLPGSVRRVEVTVSWGAAPGDRLSLLTYVGDPFRDIDPDTAVVVTQISGGSVLAPNAQARFRATVVDTSGQVIPDAIFTWYIDPDASGNGTLEFDADDSDTATFRNVVMLEVEGGTPIPSHTGDRVRVGARVRVGGVEAVGWGPELSLQEPP